MEKKRADQVLKYVLHPEEDEDYEHFKDARDNPFVPKPGAIGRLNSWWLAEAALLAYWGPEVALERFKEAGLAAEFIQEPEPPGSAERNPRDKQIQIQGVQCYVASNDEFALVAFRGTQPDQWRDVLDDALFLHTRWENTDTFVHCGFNNALKRVWPLLATKLDDLKPRAVWFTGHSLGAALATLAAARFDGTTGLCTVGSPRVGDAGFVKALEDRMGPRIARYVGDADIVTHVPPPVGYSHVGDFRHIADGGSIAREKPSFHHFFVDIFGSVKHLSEVVVGLCNGRMLHAPECLLDHMPRGYAIDMWNDYDKNGDRW